METKIDKKEVIKNRLIEWSASSTAHGFPNIIKNKSKSLKLMWTICFLISLGSCTFMIIKSIKDYLQYDVITQIRVISESPTLFPTVTICNINPFTTDYAQDFLKSFYNISSSSNTSFPQEIDPTKIAQYVKSSAFSDENRRKLGFPINETVVYAQFNSIPISHNDFEWYLNIMDLRDNKWI